MDGASAALGVVSVAIQLAETVQKLHAFWKCVQDAPCDIRQLFCELSSLHMLLVRMGESGHNLDPSSEQVLTDCEAKILRLKAQLRGPLADFGSSKYKRRKWAALKVTLEKPFIDSILTSIEKTKATLLLSQVFSLETHVIEIKNQNQLLLDLARVINRPIPLSIVENGSSEAEQAMQLKQCVECVAAQTEIPPCYNAAPSPIIVNVQYGSSPESHDRQPLPAYDRPYSRLSTLASTRDSGSIVVEKHDNPSRTNILTPLGLIHRQSAAVVRKQPAAKYSSLEMNCSYNFYPSRLLRALGVSYGISIETKAAAGWQFLLRPFNAVPSDSLIFEFCREGNVAAIRTLLNVGHASLRDRDQNGRTALWVSVTPSVTSFTANFCPLEIAVEHLQLETCKFLLEQGADTQVRDWKYDSPPISAIRKSVEVDVRRKMQIIDLISSHSPDGYDENIIAQLIGFQLLFYRPLRKVVIEELSGEARRKAGVQILKQLLPNFPPGDIGWTLVILDAINLFFDKDVLYWALQNLQGYLKVTPTISVLHTGLIRKLLHRDPLSMQMIAEKTENLHTLFGADSHDGPSMFKATATSLTMYQPGMFVAWRRLLLALGYDLDDFARLELEQGSLLEDGWTRDTLTALFACDSKPPSVSNKWGFLSCERCGKSESGYLIMVDLAWRRRLRNIRLGPNCGTQHKSMRDIKQASTSLGSGSAGKYFEGILYEFKNTKQVALPYSVVCSDSCQDGVCVARAFDNQDNNEPHLPAFGFKDVDVLEIVDENHGPNRVMPGAFIE